jgi:thiol:disulfide interchange protein
MNMYPAAAEEVRFHMRSLTKLSTLALTLTLSAAATLFSSQLLSAQALGRKHIYSETANPAADVTAALAKAKAQHKRVLIDVGGDWCGDCQVIDIYFHQQPNEALLEHNFVVVHIYTDSDLGVNKAIAAKYGIPIGKGVPALSVLDANGKIIHSQQTGEFNDMRHMDSPSVTEFLSRWRP